MKTLKFNEQMIAAIRDGRKTQTRRVMKPQPNEMNLICFFGFNAQFHNAAGSLFVRFPYKARHKIADDLEIEITGIRCGRLGDISESDCIKEGIGSAITRDLKKPQFKALWQSIYPTGAKAWRDDLVRG
jgi:hypothetical protein